MKKLALLLLFLAALPAFGQQSGNPSCFVQRQTGQTLPAGLYRTCIGSAGNDQWSIERAMDAAGAFGSKMTIVQSSAGPTSVVVTFPQGGVTVGVAGSTTGTINLTGSMSGTMSQSVAAAAGTYTFQWPNSASVFTANQVIFGAASNSLSSSANLLYDGTRINVGGKTANITAPGLFGFTDAATTDPTLSSGTHALELQNTSTTSSTLSTIQFWHGSSNMTAFGSQLNQNNQRTDLVVVAQDASGVRHNYHTFRGSGAVYFTNLTTSGAAQTDNLCLDNTGQVIADTGACLASTKTIKNPMGSISCSEAKSIVRRMNPIWFQYKNEDMPPERADWSVHAGFYAEDVAKVDERLVTYHDGRPHGVQYEMYTAVLTKALQCGMK